MPKFENCTGPLNSLHRLDHEISFLSLLVKISDGCIIEINHTGTSLRYCPGPLKGGDLKHDCDTSRSIGYFLEPLIVLGLFGEKPLNIKLEGITNDSKDPSADTFQTTTLPLLNKFGIPSEAVDLKIKSPGVPPLGRGAVVLSVSPIARDTLKAITWIDEGLVERIRGFTFSARVSRQFEQKMLQAARKIFDPLLHNVCFTLTIKRESKLESHAVMDFLWSPRPQQAAAILLIQQSPVIMQMKWMTLMMRREIQSMQTMSVNKLHWLY